MKAEEEMKRVKEFRETGRAYVAPDDDKVMDFTTRPAPRNEQKNKKPKKSKD
jgi:hypothetical protein